MKKPFVGIVVGVVAAAAPSAALAALPGVTGEGTSPPKIKPASLVYTGDGSGFFAGTHKKSHTNFGKLHWTKWTKTEALGSGANWIDNCLPDCAAGTFHSFPVTLKLTAPKVVSGDDVFTRMVVTYSGSRPAGVHTKSQTWTLGHSKKVFFWKFPA